MHRKQSAVTRATEVAKLLFRKVVFNTPNYISSEVGLSSSGKALVKEFRDNGIVKVFNEKSVAIAEHIDKNYFAKFNNSDKVIDGKYILKEGNTEEMRKAGRDISHYISFTDEKLMELFFDAEIIGIVYNYLNRQPYYRNQPLIARHTTGSVVEQTHQGKFHIDGALRQISLMLLINDLEDRDTHMQYAKKSHVWGNFHNDRFRFTDEMIEENYELENLVGKKGTFYLFDAGNGFHRALYKPNSTRKILHLNFTTGFNIDREKFDDFKSLRGFSSIPDYVKRTVNKIGKKPN